MKYDCLFLQGDTKVGKSTLLMQNLQPYLRDAGGFVVQRMTQDGVNRGFCLQALSSPPPALTIPYDAQKNNVFIEYTPQGWQQYPEVFAHAGAALLDAHALAGKKLIVLDEVGGVELLSPEFHRALYLTLGGETPCIGVLKSVCNRGKMKDKLFMESDYEQLCRQLFTDISERFGGKIITMTEKNRPLVQKEIQDFLHTIPEI